MLTSFRVSGQWLLAPQVGVWVDEGIGNPNCYQKAGLQALNVRCIFSRAQFKSILTNTYLIWKTQGQTLHPAVKLTLPAFQASTEV